MLFSSHTTIDNNNSGGIDGSSNNKMREIQFQWHFIAIGQLMTAKDSGTTTMILFLALAAK